MQRPLAVITLAALLAACGDDGPETIDPADARVQIVSGDRQTARVPSPAPQGALVPTAVVGEALLPEPLVVRVVDGAGSTSAAISIAGPSAAIVPAGTALHWRVVESGCGSPYGSTTLTDDSAYSVNRVIIGTTARECSVEVGRVLSDGEVVVDSVFRYTLLPGPPASYSLPPIVRLLEAEAWTPVTSAVRDAYGNPLPYTVEVDGAGSIIGDRSVNGGPWGAGTIRILVEDTVAREIPLRTFPDLGAISEPWLFELTCTAADTAYVDRLVFRVAEAQDLDHRFPASFDRNDAMTYRNPGQGVSRTVTANGDTVFHTTGDRRLKAMAWPIVDAATAEYLFHNPYSDSEWIFRLWSYRTVLGELMTLEGVPERIPLLTRNPLEWRTEDAVAACHSDGFDSATAGVVSIRPAT